MQESDNYVNKYISICSQDENKSVLKLHSLIEILPSFWADSFLRFRGALWDTGKIILAKTVKQIKLAIFGSVIFGMFLKYK